MAINFSNKNILIVGASLGIGRCIALELARKGANLILVARKKNPLQKLADEIHKINPKVNSTIFIADASSWNEVQSLFVKVAKLDKKIDGLISNVGFSNSGYFHEIPIKTFETDVRVNYLSAVYCARASYPYLNKGAFMSFTSSVAGLVGVFGFSPYSGPKFALQGLAETLAQELDHLKIKISVLCPPNTDTVGFQYRSETKPYETKQISSTAKLMTPERVAQVFLNKLSKGKFMITCNLESTFIYRMRNIFPSLVRKIMLLMVRSAQKKKKK